MSAGRPTTLPPRPDPLDAAFWADCRRGRLTLQRCQRCRRWQHPPGILCPNCQCESLDFEPVRGLPRLFSWTEVFHAAHPSVRDEVPYFIGVVEYPDCDGARLIARLLVSRGARPLIGDACALVWLHASDGQPVPAFTCASDGD